ncbi:hypothetical protein [Streptomyces flaveus]|uniref:hypothetical protein n=1 Tax=Streptomyces flaveus TaxID=66370 RepID=UPI00167011D9|nr:hypothetical protein [Streptomyces flaveus]
MSKHPADHAWPAAAELRALTALGPAVYPYAGDVVADGPADADATIQQPLSEP